MRASNEVVLLVGGTALLRNTRNRAACLIALLRSVRRQKRHRVRPFHSEKSTKESTTIRLKCFWHRRQKSALALVLQNKIYILT